MNGYLTAMRKYATFSGRAGRKEYWIFALVVFVMLIVCFILDPLVGIYVMQDIFKTRTSADVNGNVLASQQDGIGMTQMTMHL